MPVKGRQRITPKNLLHPTGSRIWFWLGFIICFLFMIFLLPFCMVYETHGGSDPGWHYPCGFLSRVILIIQRPDHSYGRPVFIAICLLVCLVVISYVVSCGIIALFRNFQSKLD